MYKILIISLIIFFVNEYFFKDKLLNFLGIAHKYFKTFIVILSIVAIYFSIKKENSIIDKFNTLNKINFKNPMKNIMEILINNNDFFVKDNSLNKEDNSNKELNEKFKDNKQKKETNNKKRSVSETKKKVVAHNQEWKCKKCNMLLPHLLKFIMYNHFTMVVQII